MKKRLLSAALALAMVLTMLPLTALPAFAALSGNALNENDHYDKTNHKSKVTVTYYTKDHVFQAANASTGATLIKADEAGWYYWGDAFSTASPKVKELYHADGGVISGSGTSGAWYPSVEEAIQGKVTSIKLIGDGSISTTALDSSLISSLTIDVNGKALTGTIAIPATYTANGKNVNNAFSTLTIKDSTQTGSLYNSSGSVAITVGGSGAPKPTNTIITLNNVKTGAITAEYTTSCTVNVKGAETGAITLNGTSGGAVNLGDNNLTAKTGKVTIKTTGAGTGGKVTAYNATIADGVDLSGVGANLTATNSTVNAVKLFGSNGTDTATGKALTDSQKSSLAAPSVTLNGGTATTIGAGTGKETLTKPYGVTLNGNAKVGTNIELDNANITVNNSAAGAVTLKQGDLKLNGSSTGPASADAISLGATNTKASFTVSGTNVSTGNITATANSTVNITVPNSDTNTFGTFTGNDAVKNKGISGGVWGSAVPAINLADSLVYQANGGSGKPLAGKYVYYTRDQFQKLIDVYQADNSAIITLVKDSATPKSNSITFKNGKEDLTVIKYGTPNLPITLPTSVNGGTISKWTEYDSTGNVIRDLVNSAGYSTPSTPENRVLNAQVTDNTITKLVDVSTDVDGLTARLAGNVITLSGAIPQNTTSLLIKVETDGKPPVKGNIVVVYDPSNGSVRFGNSDPGDGMTITNDWNYLVMPNQTTRYSLNGSALKVQATGLPADQVHGYVGDLPVKVTVNVSGSGWTTVRKQELEKAMSSVITAYTSSTDSASGFTFDPNSSKVAFAASPAVKELLNAVVAGITDSQINNWILGAQNAAWRKNHTTTANEADRIKTGYSEVHVVAYMAVTISNYNTASTPGTLTMTLTPSYYVEVTGTNGEKINTDYALDEKVPAQLNALRPVNGRTLGTLTGDVGTIELTLKNETAFNTTGVVAHQGNTYAYAGKSGLSFDITHAINGSLGTLIVNGEPGLVNLYDDSNKTNLKGSYDTLQAAVDDAEEGWYIDVDANYKGSCAIAVTGLARKFQINTNGANRVTSNVAGVVTEKTSGTLYEVQLERDNITNAGIAVGSAANGTASVNVTSAKPGSSVSGTYKANSGYKAGSFTATAQPGNKSVSVSVSANGTFSFTVPSDATSVTVTPSFVLDNGLPFTDVANNAWYFTAVKYCYDTTNNGYRLMEGDSAATFAPNGSFTRAHMVQILWNMKGRPTPKTTANPFRDMSSSNWYYSAVLWAYEKGYAKGYPDGTFKPGQAVTRQEMVQFLYQASGSPSGSGNLSYYSDGYTANNWAQPALRWATGLGILSGQNSASLGNTLAPRAVAKRCEVAVTVMNFDKLNLF